MIQSTLFFLFDILMLLCIRAKIEMVGKMEELLGAPSPLIHCKFFNPINYVLKSDSH